MRIKNDEWGDFCYNEFMIDGTTESVPSQFGNPYVGIWSLGFGISFLEGYPSGLRGRFAKPLVP